MSDNPPITADSGAPETLSFWTKMAYGIGDWGPALVAGINGFFLNVFLLEVAGLRPAAVGTIFLLVKIWDAVNDPLIGRLSDNTKSRWGRRRPWLLFGSIPFGLAFFLSYIVPDISPTGLFWYYLVVALLLDTGYTASNVPYAALTPELTRDYDERTSLNSFRFGWSILGGLAAILLHSNLIGVWDDPRTGYMISAAIWAGVIIASNVITFFGVKEYYVEEKSSENEMGFLKGLRIVFANKAFVLVCLIYLTSWLALQFVQNNILLWLTYYFGSTDIFNLLVLILQVCAFGFLSLGTLVSARIGKKNTYYVGIGFWMVASVALFIIPPGQNALLLIAAVVASIGVGTAYLIPWSMMPDVIELDELETGQRREGIYYGFFVFLQKMGLSLALAIANYSLELAGYVNPEMAGAVTVQNDSVVLLLRLFVSIVPLVILVISLILVRFYPITREKHAEIRLQLAQRKLAAGEAAVGK